MNKLAYLMVAFTTLIIQGVLEAAPENHEKTQVIIYKENDILNSTPIQITRSLASFGFSFIEYLYLLEACLSPLNNHPEEAFNYNLLGAFINLNLAELIKVKELKIKIKEKENEKIDIIDHQIVAKITT